MHLFKFLLLLLFLVLLTVPIEARTWTDKSGRKSFEAEIVETLDDNVVFKKSNGQIVSYKISDLSKKDQNYLNHLKTQKNQQTRYDAAAPKVTLPQGIRIEPIAVSISKADPIKETPTFVKGTQITFLITSSGNAFAAVDRDQVKLECTDDIGSRIGTEKNSVITLKTDALGRQILVTLSMPTLPKTGTKKLILSGSVPTNVSEGKKTTMDHPVSLTENPEFSLLDQDVIIQKMADDDFMNFATDIAKMKIAFLSEQPLDHIDTIEFFDENNEFLTSCAGESLQKEIGGKTYFVKEYYLASITDAFSVKIDFYKKSKVTVLPVALTIDFGL